MAEDVGLRELINGHLSHMKVEEYGTVPQKATLDYIMQIIADHDKATQDRMARFYKKELDHWKRTAESFIARENLKIEPVVICASCGNQLNQSQDKETK